MSSLLVRVSPQLHGTGGESSLTESSEQCLVINDDTGFTISTFEMKDRRKVFERRNTP